MERYIIHCNERIAGQIDDTVNRYFELSIRYDRKSLYLKGNFRHLSINIKQLKDKPFVYEKKDSLSI